MESKSIPFKIRLAVYLGLWTLAIVIGELFYHWEPGDPAWYVRLLYLPMMLFLPVLDAIKSGSWIGTFISFIFSGSVLLVAVLILKTRRPWIFFVCCALHAVLLGVYVYIGYILSDLDSGG